MGGDRQLLGSPQEVSLVEILDRALGAGVVITGDLTLSLADVDLVYLDLRLLLSSVGTLRGAPALDPASDRRASGSGGVAM
jgi:hypothetical protein